MTDSSHSLTLLAPYLLSRLLLQSVSSILSFQGTILDSINPSLPETKADRVVLSPGYSAPSHLFLALSGIQDFHPLDVIHLRPLMRGWLVILPTVKGLSPSWMRTSNSPICDLSASSRTVRYHSTSTSIATFGVIF